MSFERQFLDFSTQAVTVEPLSTVGAYGAPAFSTSAATYTAYIEPGTRLVTTPQGMQEVATATLYVMSSSASIGVQDRVTLHDGRKPKLLSVDLVNDDEGQHHVEVAIR